MLSTNMHCFISNDLVNRLSASLTLVINLAKMTAACNSSLGIDKGFSGATFVLEVNNFGTKQP